MIEESTSENMLQEPLLLHTSKGGLKTLPFIIVNEAFEKVASYGIIPNMIMYLMGSYGMELATASTFIYYWSAATNLAPVVGAFIADAYVGRFWMISFGSFFSLLGMLLLWFTSIIPGARPCDDSGLCTQSSNLFQLTLLALSFGIMSIGTGGIRSSSLAFGTDQVLKKGNTSSILERFLNWYNFAASAGVIAALTLVVYIQDHFGWKVGFGVPVVLMFLSALSFLLASPLYIKYKAQAGSPVAFARVLMAAWKKRRLCSSNQDDDAIYYRTKCSAFTRPSEKLRYLNKACIVEDALEESTLEGEAKNTWSLCTIDQVEELKALLKVIPMWSTGVIMAVTTTQMPFKVLLTKSMDRHITSNFEIPAGSFATFSIVAIVLWIAIYDLIIIPLASKVIGKPANLSPRIRMGIGLVMSFVSMAVMALIESVRRETAIKEGFADDPSGVTTMSALWLLPHHWFSGMGEAMFLIGQMEFFCTEFPKSMLSVATNLNGVGMSLASVLGSVVLNSIDYISGKFGKESWVSSNINKAHFDYFYWVITAMSFVNIFYYVLCNKAYGHPSKGNEELWDSQETNVIMTVDEGCDTGH